VVEVEVRMRVTVEEAVVVVMRLRHTPCWRVMLWLILLVEEEWQVLTVEVVVEVVMQDFSQVVWLMVMR
jgi:hypothetical protein